MGINEPFYPIPQTLVTRYGADSPEVCAWVELIAGADRHHKTSFTHIELCARFRWSPRRSLAFVANLVDQGWVTQRKRNRKRTELDFSRLYGDSGNETGNATETPRARSDLSLREKNKDTPVQNPPPEGFETFWTAYPRKTAKPAAIRTWKAIKPNGAEIQTMLRALNYWRNHEDWQKAEGKYIPYPATWLNQRRWEDQIPGVTQPTERKFQPP